MFGLLKKSLSSLSEKLGLAKKQEPEQKEMVQDKEESKKEVAVIKQEEILQTKKESTKETISKDQVKITYFAHGTTSDNEKGLFSGQNSVGLSELGKQQMIDLKPLLKLDFDFIFTSDLVRAVESTKLTWPEKEIIKDKRLREVDVGDFTSQQENQIEEYLQEVGLDVPFPNGESIKELELRMVDFINYLFDNFKGKHVAILSHKYTQLAIDVLLKNISWEKAIKEDWRTKTPKKWQPGWDYLIKKKLEIKAFTKKVEFEPQGVEEIKQPEKELGLKEKLEELAKEIEIEKKPLPRQTTKKKEIKLEIPKEAEQKKEEASVSIFTKLKSVFSERYKLADSEISELLDNFELSLLQSDVSLKVCEILKKELAKKLQDGVPKKDLPAFLKQLFLEIVFANYPKPVESDFFNNSKKPFVIMFVGTNGGGKTTSIAKLTNYLKSKSKSVVLAASDTYRAAAIDQLEGHANKLDVPIIKGKYGQDPASVAFDALTFAKTKNIDFVLVDTSGRQDNALNLMKELEKIKRVINPDFVVFVAEAIAGQTALQQAESFNKMVNFNAFVLTKTDVDEKGGTLLSIALGLQKPVLFLGIGQEYKDMVFFDKKFLEGVI